MKATDFIKTQGLDKAREVVEGAPEHWTTYTTGGGLGGGYIRCSGSVGQDEVSISDLKHLVDSVDIINKFDSVQEAKDAISNAPEGATDYRKLSCTIRYIKQSERFFEYWDGSIWCRPAVPFTDETHILRFTELSRLKQAIADVEACQAPTLDDLGDDTNLENRISPLCKVQVQ